MNYVVIKTASCIGKSIVHSNFTDPIGSMQGGKQESINEAFEFAEGYNYRRVNDGCGCEVIVKEQE